MDIKETAEECPYEADCPAPYDCNPEMCREERCCMRLASNAYEGEWDPIVMDAFKRADEVYATATPEDRQYFGDKEIGSRESRKRGDK